MIVAAFVLRPHDHEIEHACRYSVMRSQAC